MKQTLGERLKARRVEKGWSMAQAADMCGVTKNRIFRLETQPVSKSRFGDVCRVLIGYGYGERAIYEITFDARNADV